MNNKSKTIAVLMGGVSSEREVSIASGKAIVNALSSLGYNVIEHDISSTDINFNNLNIDLAFIALHGQYGEDGTIQAQLENMKIPFTGSCSFSSNNTFDKIKTRKILEKSSNATIVFPLASLNLCNTSIPFNSLKTPSYEMGAFSEFLRKKDNSLRSLHPFWSVGAIGPLAEKLTKNIITH